MRASTSPPPVTLSFSPRRKLACPDIRRRVCIMHAFYITAPFSRLKQEKFPNSRSRDGQTIFPAYSPAKRATTNDTTVTFKSV